MPFITNQYARTETKRRRSDFSAINVAHAGKSDFMFVLHSVSPLDTSNTVHETYITGQGVNRRGLEIGGGYIPSTWIDQIFNRGR